MLRAWMAAGSASPPGHVYAVTASLREWYREGDADELEHAAASLAAAAALDLLAVDAAAPARRVVLAADVADADCIPDPAERGALRLREPVPSARWASALIDDEGAATAVGDAVGLLRDRSADPADVDFALGEAEATELGWYAIQELPFL